MERVSQTLEDRYLQFLGSLTGSESLDAMADEIPDGIQLADFLVCDKSAVVEVKTLKSDVSEKIENIVDSLRDRPDFPLFYGEMELHKVLAHLPDGHDINAEIFERSTRSMEKAFKKADDQIGSTKNQLGIPEAGGVVVFLSEDVDAYEPEVLACKAAYLLGKREPNGDFRYSNVQCVLVVCTTHFVPLTGGPNLFPLMAVNGPTARDYPTIRAVVDGLQTEWCQYENVPLVDIEVSNLKDAPFSLTSRDRGAKPEKIRRQDLWRREYKDSPYLSDLSLGELQDFGVSITNELLSAFEKGGRKPSQERLIEQMRRWTHFMEESNRRGLDMRVALPHDRIRPKSS